MFPMADIHRMPGLVFARVNGFASTLESVIRSSLTLKVARIFPMMADHTIDSGNILAIFLQC